MVTDYTKYGVRNVQTDKNPQYITIQLIADCMAYRLPRLLNEYLEFSGVNGFVSTIF